MSRSGLLLASMALALPALAQSPQWAAYAAKADGFSVLMPSKVQMQTQNTQGVTTHIYIATAAPFVCAASKTTLPASVTKADRDAIAPAMLTAMMNSAHATKGRTYAMTYGGIRGEQTEFKGGNGGAGATWIAQTPRAVYSLTLAKQSAPAAAEMKRFFGSFKLR